MRGAHEEPRLSEASSKDEILASLDDAGALERAIRSLPSVSALLPILVGAVPSGATLFVPPRGLFDVAAARRLGRAGLWLATDAVRARLPSITTVPSAIHERWDTLVELERERPEAPWLVGVLVASMSAAQESLASRTLLGVERRFGARGWSALALATVGAPMEELVRRRAPARS